MPCIGEKAVMALSDLTKNSVLQALAEFDEIGRDAFLDRYEFGKARGYFLVHNGHRMTQKQSLEQLTLIHSMARRR